MSELDLFSFLPSVVNDSVNDPIYPSPSDPLSCSISSLSSLSSGSDEPYSPGSPSSPGSGSENQPDTAGRSAVLDATIELPSDVLKLLNLQALGLPPEEIIGSTVSDTVKADSAAVSSSSSSSSLSSSLSSIPITSSTIISPALGSSSPRPHIVPIGNPKGRKRKDETLGIPIPPGLSLNEIQNLMNDNEKTKAKKARKALLAREGRRKKNVRMNDLELQVAALQAELEKAKEENKRLVAEQSNGVVKRRRKKSRVMSTTPDQAISAIVESDFPIHQSEDKLHQLVIDVSEAFKAQATTAEAHVRCIENNIMPCTPLRFLDWVLTQRDAFYEDESGLFYSLFRDEMKATPEQLQQVLELKKIMIERGADKVKDQVLVSAFRAFDQLLRVKGSLSQPEYFERLRSIFTPKQLAIYFKWVQKFGPICVKIHV